MFDFQGKRQVMGILNVTPDSFSDGGEYRGVAAAQAHAEELIAAGADWLDLGGQSTRPGYQEVTPEEELARVLPVLKAIRPLTELPISIDTYFPEVASACIAAGADVINDIKGLDIPGMLDVLRQAPQVGIVVMHSRIRQEKSLDEDLAEFYQEKMNLLTAAGIEKKRICFDPGVGFGKTVAENLSLIQDPERYRPQDYPLLYGVSRKRTIGFLTGEERPERRDPGSVAASLWALEKGVEIVRVHDVFSMQQANRVFQTLHL